ncbi:unnamed protein product [Moneuplotes crassus]|uniref:Ubiquitin carboxyl-terminal hydrolase n=1 Tax=Euplotes crassus TaxID=5936 RepID=A0AAD1Y556_EUPCR|nr:unnamed protein product [Moneuplotes crassus]
MKTLDKESLDLKEESFTVERNLHLRHHKSSLDQSLEDNKTEVNSSQIEVDGYQNLSDPSSESILNASFCTQGTNRDIFEVTQSAESLTIPSKGLCNFGNDCFANASFQLLFSVAPLIRSFLDAHSSGSFASTSDVEVTSKFARLVNAYCNSETRVVRDRACRKCFSGQFTLNWQHDASQFISTLFEKIQQEHDKNDSILSFSEYDTWQSAWKFYREERTSIIDKLFTGFYQNTFRCKHCSAEEKNFEEFKNIPVYFNEDENEESQFYCKTCEDIRDCIIEKKVMVSPELLLLPIQRMDPFTMQKRHDFMEYEEDVRICTSEEGAQNYSLISVICHYGSIGFGHYTAYCKRQGTWKYYDDASVDERDQNYLNGDAYILLYQKQREIKNKLI